VVIIMKTKDARFVTVMLVTGAAAILDASRALPADSLAALRKEFRENKARAELRLSRHYLQKLTGLRNRLAIHGDRKKISAVDEEIRRINARMASLGEKPPSILSPREMPAPKHVVRNYVVQAKGWAGIPEFSKNNVYSFELPEIGDKTTLTFYASGRTSTDTYGDVYLVTPEGKQKRVYRWSPDDFEIPLKEAMTYRHLKPVRVDISGLVRKPGRYQVRFQYRDGDDPLGILRVEIKS